MSVVGSIRASPIDLNHPGHYLHSGFVLISVANLVVIIVMLALFVAALLLPFVRIRAVAADPSLVADPLHRGAPGPDGDAGQGLARSGHAGNGSGGGSNPGGPPASDRADAEVDGGLRASAGADAGALRGSVPGTGDVGSNWTGDVRRLGLRYLPPAKLLPDAQPAYVASWVYVFGVATIGALVVVVVSGLALAVYGPAWWHTSWVGHYVNSVHLWSVELFMGFMIVHLWAKFWMAAWRGGRSFTWMTGVVCFLVAVIEAFTGYISQTNFDSQWIAFEAKDGLNSGGIGAFLNPMNFGQALMLHIALLPVAIVAVTAVHVLLVRVHGVVPPIDARLEDLVAPDAGGPPALLVPPPVAPLLVAPPLVAPPDGDDRTGSLPEAVPASPGVAVPTGAGAGTAAAPAGVVER